MWPIIIKPGPATLPGEVSYRIANPSFRNETDDFGQWYIADNVVEGKEKVSANNWNGGVQTRISFEKIKLEKAWPSLAIDQQTAEEAYILVLKNAGAILPKRDVIDARIIEETRTGSATYEGKSYKNEHQVADSGLTCGIIDTQKDVGGWPELSSAPAPKDSDHDGMPDVWEKKKGLDPGNPEDRNQINQDGYTMLETYLNSL